MRPFDMIPHWGPRDVPRRRPSWGSQARMSPAHDTPGTAAILHHLSRPLPRLFVSGGSGVGADGDGFELDAGDGGSRPA